MPLDVPPSRTSRFGSPLVLSRVHWVRPQLVAEVKFLTWTDDNRGWVIVRLKFWSHQARDHTREGHAG